MFAEKKIIKYKKILLICTISLTMIMQNNSYAKNDNNIIITQLKENLDVNDPSLYFEAQQNLLRAKEIKNKSRRRKQLRNAGISESEIKRIMAEESKQAVKIEEKPLKNEIKKQKKNKNEDDDYENEDKDDYDEDDENNEENNPTNQYDFFTSRIPKKTKIEKKQTHINTINSRQEDNNIKYQQTQIDFSDDTKYKKTKKQRNQEYTINPTEEDLAIRTLAKKAGRNTHDATNFKVFTSQLSKVAQKPATELRTNKDILEEAMLVARKQEVEKQLLQYQKMQKNTNLSELQTYSYNLNKTDKKSSMNNKYNIALKKNDTYNQKYAYAKNNDRFYAVAPKSPLKKNNKNKINKKQTEEDQIDFGDEPQTISKDIETKNSTIGKNTLSNSQVKAKNIGAPTPLLRNSKDKRTQIYPQNIAQTSYDKNNKHLQPIVFKEHIINEVFEHLQDKNSVEIVRTLINKFGKADITDEHGNTLLMHAVALQHYSLITMLLAEGADPNKENNEGFTPLHLASSNGDNTAIYYLMMNGGNPNKRDQDGNSALMYAVIMCGVDTIKLMSSLGGDATAVNSMTGKSVLDYANYNDNKEVLNFLQQKRNLLYRSKQAKDLT